MGNPIPIQERSVDPYSSYDSNVVNKLTRMISDGNDILLMPSPIKCEYLSSSTITVKAGKAIMDDVLIETEDIVLDFADKDYYVSNTLNQWGDVGYYLIVLCYKYVKTSPAPSASIKIIKAYQKSDSSIYKPEEQMFINAIKVEYLDGANKITEILSYDPDDITRKRNYAGGGGVSSGTAANFKDINTSVNTLTSDDDNVAVYSTGANRTLYLPLVSTTSRILRIVKVTSDSNTVTIIRSGTDMIEAATNVVLKTQWECVTLMPYPALNTWIQI